MTVWLLDTGPLVAFYDRSDADHAWARERWGRAPVPLLTCEAVLAEAAYLLREHDGLPGSKLLALFERQAITAPFRLEDHAGPVARLMEKNHDQDMQLGDAYVVRMSELHRDCRVRERGPPRRSATRNLGYDNIKNRPLYESQVRLLAKVIAHQGWRSPVVVSTRSGFIVAGHGRYDAARMLGLTDVPVDYQDFATEADEWAHLVADNRIAELAEADEAALKELLGELKATDFEMELAGFDADALAGLLAVPAEPEPPEDFPEADEDLPTEHQCPKCGFQWSGKASQE